MKETEKVAVWNVLNKTINVRKNQKAGIQEYNLTISKESIPKRMYRLPDKILALG